MVDQLARIQERSRALGNMSTYCFLEGRIQQEVGPRYVALFRKQIVNGRPLAGFIGILITPSVRFWEGNDDASLDIYLRNR